MITDSVAESSVVIHTQTLHEARPYVCDASEKTFTTLRSFSEDQQLHKLEDERPFQCLPCGKSFSRPRYLVKHLQTGGHKLRTGQSGNESVVDSSLSSNTSPHISPFKTPDEGTFEQRRFPSPPGPTDQTPLTRRSKKSKGDVSFPQGDREGDNMRHFSKRRSHKCDVCDKTFLTSWHLSRHAWSHTPRDEWPFKCLLCKSTFYWQACLQLHLKSGRHKIKVSQSVDSGSSAASQLPPLCVRGGDLNDSFDEAFRPDVGGREQPLPPSRHEATGIVTGFFPQFEEDAPFPLFDTENYDFEAHNQPSFSDGLYQPGAFVAPYPPEEYSRPTYSYPDSWDGTYRSDGYQSQLSDAHDYVQSSDERFYPKPSFGDCRLETLPSDDCLETLPSDDHYQPQYSHESHVSSFVADSDSSKSCVEVLAVTGTPPLPEDWSDRFDVSQTSVVNSVDPKRSSDHSSPDAEESLQSRAAAEASEVSGRSLETAGDSPPFVNQSLESPHLVLDDVHSPSSLQQYNQSHAFETKTRNELENVPLKLLLIGGLLCEGCKRYFKDVSDLKRHLAWHLVKSRSAGTYQKLLALLEV